MLIRTMSRCGMHFFWVIAFIPTAWGGFGCGATSGDDDTDTAADDDTDDDTGDEDFDDDSDDDTSDDDLDDDLDDDTVDDDFDDDADDDTSDDDLDDDLDDDTGDDDSIDDDTSLDCTWTLETIRDCPDGCDSVDLTLNGDGTPAVAYSLWDPSTLAYADRASGDWVEQVVDDVDTNSAPVLAIGGDGEPQIANWHFFDYGYVPVLRVSHRAGGVWTGTNLIPWYEGTDVPAIAADNNGALHLAAGTCSSAIEGDAWYFTNQSGHWALRWHSAEPTLCPGVSIAVDADRQPWLAYSGAPYYFEESTLWVAHSTGVPFAWPVEVAAPSTGPAHFSIALTIAGEPLVAFNPIAFPLRLSLADRRGGTWTDTDIAWSLTIRSGRSLAVDADGHAHVVAIDENRGALVYGNDVSGSWHFQDVRASGSFRTAALVLDAGGRPRMAFIDDVSGEILYAACTP